MKLSDAEALDRIQHFLHGCVWSPELLDNIAEIVRATGREVADVENDD